MSFSKSLDRITNKLYKKVRAYGKKYYLIKTAKRDLSRHGSQILSQDQKKMISDFYEPYFKPNMVFHELYYQLTGVFDVKFIPDDIFSNVIDRYFNDSKRAVVLENKCYFEKMFEGVRLPKAIASRINGFWYMKNSEVLTENELIERIEGQTVVLKQACGSFGGHSVVFLEKCTSNELKEVIKKISEDIIIQEPIIQHKVLSTINPTSVNTVRVLSLLTKDGKVKILSCFLRCGRNGSRVDNTSSGGFACGIDTNGVLKKNAYSRSDYKNATTVHPDSHVTFEGMQVPSWDELIQMVKKAHPQIPHFRMVSWDITVDSEGRPILIEANLNDGVNRTHQILNGPIFKEDTEEVLKEVFHHG